MSNLHFLCQCSALLQQTSDEGYIGKGRPSLPQVVCVTECFSVRIMLNQSRVCEVRHFRGHICNHQNHKNTTMMPSLHVVMNTESYISLCKRFSLVFPLMPTIQAKNGLQSWQMLETERTLQGWFLKNPHSVPMQKYNNIQVNVPLYCLHSIVEISILPYNVFEGTIIYYFLCSQCLQSAL